MEYDSCENFTVSDNEIVNITDYALRLLSSQGFTVSENSVAAYHLGLQICESQNNIVTGNNITGATWVGIWVEWSSSVGNRIFHNNIIGNQQQALVSWTTGQTTSIWDDGYPSGGNYWSDYTGTDLNQGLYQNETGSDGIGDAPYTIGANNTDNYPLMNPWPRHDIAVTNLTCAKTVIGRGYDFNITVRKANLGSYQETFNLTLYVTIFIIQQNVTLQIASQNVTLESGNNANTTFIVNTTGYPYGNYTISAYAKPVLDETKTANNNLTGGWVVVAGQGDLTGGTQMLWISCQTEK